MQTATATLADDLLYGAGNISRYIGRSERQTYHLLETQQIPAAKVGGQWTASKSGLRRHFATLTGSESAA